MRQEDIDDSLSRLCDGHRAEYELLRVHVMFDPVALKDLQMEVIHPDNCNACLARDIRMMFENGLEPYVNDDRYCTVHLQIFQNETAKFHPEDGVSWTDDALCGVAAVKDVLADIHCEDCAERRLAPGSHAIFADPVPDSAVCERLLLALEEYRDRESRKLMKEDN